MKDALWEWVKRSITPMGKPVRNEPRFERWYPMPSIDLHGQTVQDAHLRSAALVDQNRSNGVHSYVVVTGKSGVICREFPDWMEQNPAVQSVEPMNGGGAYRVKLKR
jgi:DNA-nicking Smr family endonuclease